MVFDYGEKGRKFYVVLEGSVEVHVPVIKEVKLNFIKNVGEQHDESSSSEDEEP